jgi:hypothetical protein
MTIETTPQPGSRIGAAASGSAQELPDAAAVAMHQSDLVSVQPDMQPVPVDSVRPNTGVYNTVVIQPGAIRELLPQDPTRRTAFLMSIDQDIVLAANKDLAGNAQNQVASVPYPVGGYLPKLTLLPLTNRGLLWAANTSTSVATRVTVIVERDESPSPFGG